MNIKSITSVRAALAVLKVNGYTVTGTPKPEIKLPKSFVRKIEKKLSKTRQVVLVEKKGRFTVFSLSGYENRRRFSSKMMTKRHELKSAERTAEVAVS